MFKRKWITLIIIGITFFITGCSQTVKDDVIKEAVREKTSVDQLVIKKSDITEVAKFYPVEVDGVTMEVIAVKASDGSIRTAFNACQVCADSGRGYYIQIGRKFVCQNCGNEFDVDELEQARYGCNPAPITKSDKTEDSEYINIPKETFIANKSLYL